MKVKSNYLLRKVVDVYAIIGIGSDAYAPNQIMSLNETGVFLWRMLEQGAEEPELADSLTREFDVDSQTAARDVERFLSQLREQNLLEA